MTPPLLRLQVDWEDEQCCFEGIACELGWLYALLPPDLDDGAEVDVDADDDARGGGKGGGDAASDAAAAAVLARARATSVSPAADAMLRHTLFPAFRRLLMPPREFATERTVVQLASLDRLYRVFERC